MKTYSRLTLAFLLLILIVPQVAKSLHAEAQPKQSSLDPAVEKQLEEMGLVRQKDTWRLKAETELDELISRYRKLAIDYKKLWEKRIKAARYLRSANKKPTTNKPTKSKYSLDQAKQMALIQSRKQLGTNRTPSLAALDHVATYSGGRTRSSGIFGRGGAFKSSATSENQRKFDEQFVKNVRSLFLATPAARITMQDVQQMRVKIIESETKKAQEQFKTKQKPNPVAVRNWIRKGYSGTSDGNGEFERNILRECQRKYSQLMRGESSSSKNPQSSKKTGAITTNTVETFDAEMFAIAPEIQNLYSEINLKFDQVSQSRKAFSINQDEAMKLLAASSQSLKIVSDHQMRRKQTQFQKMLSGVRNQDGEKDGVWTEWDSAGQKQAEIHYKDGKEIYRERFAF